MGIFTSAQHALADWLSPECVVCGQVSRERVGEANACSACVGDLPTTAVDDVCPRCGEAGTAGAVCGRCLKHPPTFDCTFAAMDYRFPAHAILQRFKYAGDFALAPLLTYLLYTRLAGAPRPDVVLVAPLARARLAERGFNQVLELAKPLAARLGLAIDPHAITKPRDTAHQAELPFKARKANIRGAFACTKQLPKHVAILDDVMTTSATMNELAKVARAAGATQVSAWAVLRTQPRDIASGRAPLNVDTQDV
jgi:ComF family protein